MTLVLSGKQKPLQAGVLANVGRERLAGGQGYARRSSLQS